nr:hypothetical protein [Salinirubrum litoreum]
MVGRDVGVVGALLVLPFAATWVSPRFASPLALPGYLVYTVGSAVGNALLPNYALWVYWAPFLLASYAVSVLVAGAGRVTVARLRDDG